MSTSYEQLAQILKNGGFDRFGLVDLKGSTSTNFYRQWLDEGMAGDMTYLKDHLPIKENPQSHWPWARTAIVTTLNYSPHPSPQPGPPSGLRTAMYAQGQDYHLFFKKDLEGICEKLKNRFPNDQFLAMTDSSPVLERDLAYRAGLGWIGKNTCTIDRERGSLFFIGEIFTSLAVFFCS